MTQQLGEMFVPSYIQRERPECKETENLGMLTVGVGVENQY